MDDRFLEAGLWNVESGLLRALERLDVHTSSHCARVDSLALAFGHELGLRSEELMILGTAARFHDVGKVAIPAAILHKDGPLNEAEWQIMKTHSVHGERMVRLDRDLPGTDHVALAVRHHHEHYDGSGYPDQLRGHTIPLSSRVLSVVDAYDAIRNRRSYHACRSHVATVAILADERGSKHDPQILDAFLSHGKEWFDRLGALDP